MFIAEVARLGRPFELLQRQQCTFRHFVPAAYQNC
jgi:hypothetical protein